MIIHGSINYTPSGRRRGRNGVRRVKKVAKPFKPLQHRNNPPRDVVYYPSHQSTKAIEGTVVERPKSDKHTIAIAYNKGPYQVILGNEIKDIGK